MRSGLARVCRLHISSGAHLAAQGQRRFRQRRAADADAFQPLRVHRHSVAGAAAHQVTRFHRRREHRAPPALARLHSHRPAAHEVVRHRADRATTVVKNEQRRLATWPPNGTPKITFLCASLYTREMASPSNELDIAQPEQCLWCRKKDYSAVYGDRLLLTCDSCLVRRGACSVHQRGPSDAPGAQNAFCHLACDAVRRGGPALSREAVAGTKPWFCSEDCAQARLHAPATARRAAARSREARNALLQRRDAENPRRYTPRWQRPPTRGALRLAAMARTRSSWCSTPRAARVGARARAARSTQPLPAPPPSRCSTAPSARLSWRTDMTCAPPPSARATARA